MEEMREFHSRALDHIASKAHGGPDFGNRNIFVGEYGFRNRRCTEEEKAERVTGIFEVNAEWGCPFTLYWQMYDNEYTDETKTTCRGFWLINDQREKVPSYYVHQEYLGGINVLKNLYRYWLGRNPTHEETNSYGANFREFSPSSTLVKILNGPEYQRNGGNGNPLESLDGDEFRQKFSDEAFVRHVLEKMYGHANFDIEQDCAKQILAKLAAGKKRSTVWLEALDSDEFALAELGPLRNDDQIDSPQVREKYWFAGK